MVTKSSCRSGFAARNSNSVWYRRGESSRFLFLSSLSIFYAIAAVADSMFSVSFPILSAMNDCRKRLVWKMMKLSLVISLPISSAASAYSDEILEVFGPEYIQASVTLKIMLLSMLTITFSIAISTLVYSYGNYRQVLEIGLSSSISIIFCYMVVTPAYGITGAAQLVFQSDLLLDLQFQ